MDSQPQLVRSQFHDQYGPDRDLHDRHTGEGDDEHEKKSVLKKVKAKAKKLKDTLTKHGHGHDHEHNNYIIQDDHDLDEEEEDDEEVVYDHEVHGGTGKRAVPGRMGRSGGNMGKAGVIGGTNLPLQQPESVAQPPATVVVVDKYVAATDPSKILLYGRDEGVNLDRPRGGLEEDPDAPNDIHIPANYQTKVAGPTHAGGQEMDVTPILDSFGRVSVHDEINRSKPPREDLINQYSTGTGTHNQFSPDPFPQTQQQQQHHSDSSYTGTGTHNQLSPEPFPQAQHDEYSNLPYTGTGTHNLFASTEPTYHHDHDSDPILPVTGTLSSHNYSTQHADDHEYSGGRGLVDFAPEKVLPRESSVPLEYSREWPKDESDGSSSYTDKISSAAISAKNAVASKLGYGEGENVNNNNNYKPITATATEYGKKMYEKVAGAGSAVMSKLPGMGAGTEEQDKGVSVREYITEKLRPGEEDRALSEVISEALHKRKEETGRKEEEPMGADEIERVAERVTESEEVKRQLGTGEDKVGHKVAENYVNSPESGVVNKLTDAVGSWFMASDPTHSSPTKPSDPTQPSPTRQGE